MRANGRLEGRVALVVRAGSAFGRAAVERFRAEGALTVAHDGEADVDGHRTAVRDALETHGTLDILVVPPPVVHVRGVLQADADDDRADVNAAVRTAFFLVQVAAGAMRPGGRVCIAAPARSAGSPVDALAPATLLEGAVIALTRLLAVELAPRGIAVNALCPVAADADPADVAGALAFLASDDGSYVLGAFIPVAGRGDGAM